MATPKPYAAPGPTRTAALDARRTPGRMNHALHGGLGPRPGQLDRGTLADTGGGQEEAAACCFRGRLPERGWAGELWLGLPIGRSFLSRA
jgi:hypothetical protein